MPEASQQIKEYFTSIKKGVGECYEIAEAARKQSLDPEDKVEIPAVEDMAGRVEGLLSVLVPQIVGSGVRERIKELEKEYGSLDWRISLLIAHEIALEKYCSFTDKKEALEVGIRAGLAYHTMGVVASPLEGFVELKIRTRFDNGREYFALRFSGPIRSAGGTGASVCVLIADYVRKKMGYATYDPTEIEIKRVVRELYDYHERITNLQYLPSEEEIAFLTKNLPVQIDGDRSEKLEVSNYKDLERIDTNNIRNGVCLVTGEGLAQKAPKLWKQLSKWGHEFDLEQWDFLKEFIQLQKKIKAKGQGGKKKDGEKISPDYTFIKDMVAGRPVFTHPMRNGGFRLRYGRSRVSGFSSNGVHPASMHILNEYAATGTQFKMERPGKACSLTVCDALEGPIVKLEDGSVLQLHSVKASKTITKKVVEILYLGDMLINYGDFFNRAHKLVPPGYCGEWWILELDKISKGLFGDINDKKLSELCGIDIEVITQLRKNPFTGQLSAKDAIRLSQKAKVPMHPNYTYYWDTLNKEQFKDFLDFLDEANFQDKGKNIQMVLPLPHPGKRALELLGISHIVVQKNFAILGIDDSLILKQIFFDLSSTQAYRKVLTEDVSEILPIINSQMPFLMRDKTGMFLGCRMGRPEKAKMRRLTGSPHVLFPVGDEGGRLRSFNAALDEKKITGDFPTFWCLKCNEEREYRKCRICGEITEQKYYCRQCDKLKKEEECPQHGPNKPFRRKQIDSVSHVKCALSKIGMRQIPSLVKGVRGTSNKSHIPEHLSKGMLRAKHGVYVNKDGTIRYDMSELGITHFKPIEIGTSIVKLKELGYIKDIKGDPLENETQVLEIKPQDVILPSLDAPFEGADKVLKNVANFVDEMLVKLYGLKPYYNIKKSEDLAGHLVGCLAPHTSAAIVARIIGFSKLQGFFAHPMIHAAQRRDLDGDESCVALLLDMLINFSRHFLPSHRGSTQDAPLVLTSTLTPAEVDDMVFDMDVTAKYPLEFYEACMEYKNPWDIKIDQIKERLGKEEQYEGMMFTHPTTNINDGVRVSAYKTLASMTEKLEGQMDLAQKIRAVDMRDVARLVIERHFIRDTMGNLRKFSMQQFRCVKCNEKFRRTPLVGKCTKCGSKIIFTISEGSVVKYLEKSVTLSENYDVSPYLKQTIQLLQRRIEYVFGKEKEKQEGLNKWFG